MPFSVNTVPGPGVHTESIWSRLWSAIRGKQHDKPVVAPDTYQPIGAVDPQNPEAVIAAAAGAAPRLAVANKHQALARVIEHLTVQPGGFGVMSRYLRGMTPSELEESCFLKYLHDLDDKFIIFLEDPPGIITCGMELEIDKKTGRFNGIWDLDLYSRRISHNKAPVY